MWDRKGDNIRETKENKTFIKECYLISAKEIRFKENTVK